ncbi:Hypothetical predicted protein [Olea europaea subsp. europaea]|uniref:Uncharacterized protein n=1 Tax=Olea europaea subsp. europaea TaxID=158383 RepID=A0A8S0T1A6_OLEEU|nr:Hypothetical predicted protein [Olea europaea subsp. europaea]
MMRMARLSDKGIILSDTQLVFATLDGDIHIAVINGVAPLRRALVGDVVNDGVLVDFTGCNQWWVLQAVLFMCGVLTNPDAVMGWHLLNELTELIGREEEIPRGIAVSCFDTNEESMVIVDSRTMASFRQVDTLEEACRFRVGGASQRGILG